MQLLEVLKNTSINTSGTYLEFDKNGNPNIGYNLIEWVWESPKTNLRVVGSFDDELSINKSLLKWHTDNAEVISETH